MQWAMRSSKQQTSQQRKLCVSCRHPPMALEPIMKKTSLALAILFALTACDKAPTPSVSPAPAAATTAVPAVNTDDVYASATARLFQARPLSASAFSLSEQQVGKAFAADVDIYSASAEAQLRSDLAAQLKQLEQGPPPSDDDAADNLAVMKNLLGFYIGAPDVPQGYIDMWMGHSPFVINQINGPIIDMPGALVSSHPIKSTQDAENYIARLEKLGPALTAVGDKFELDAAKDWIPPRVLLDKALKILNNYASKDTATHPLMNDFNSKLAALTDLNAEQKTALTQKASQAISTVVAPAYQALAVKVQQSLPHAKLDAGIWTQPGGDAFYAYSVRQLGDTDLTPAQIHQIGLDEVARISKQMDAILKANGYSEGSVGDRMAQLNEEERFLYPDSDAGRQQLLDDLNGYIKGMDARMAEQFGARPPYAVEVRRIPVELQDSAAGGQYTSPAIDGSKPGIYWINLADMKANPKFDLKSLTYHEAVPGHHWQIALNLAQDKLPLLRRLASYNAYSEGWALYSEQVAAEMGMYKGDPFGDLGRLKAELFRSVRLVVDTGMHAKRWSREQAIQYMADTTGTASSDVISEIERYMAWPGQALGYKLGMLKIVQLRAEAQQALGAKFDIKAFHDEVLLGGAMPMTVLEQRVKRFIARQQAN